MTNREKTGKTGQRMLDLFYGIDYRKLNNLNYIESFEIAGRVNLPYLLFEPKLGVKPVLGFSFF